MTRFEKVTFFVTLIATAISSAMLIATSSLHRLLFRTDDKEQIVLTGNKLAIAGFFFLAVAMSAAVLTVATVLYGRGVGIATGSSVAALIAFLWYGIALHARLAGR